MKPYYVPTYSGFMLPCNLFISIYNRFLQGQLTLWNQSRKSKTNFGYLHGMCWNDDSWICSVRNCLFNQYLCTYVHIVGPVLFKNMQDSTNTRNLDKKSVGMPGTQPACVGKFSVFVVVLIFLFTFRNVNNNIKTNTENLHT